MNLHEETQATEAQEEKAAEQETVTKKPDLPKLNYMQRKEILDLLFRNESIYSAESITSHFIAVANLLYPDYQV